MDKIFTSIFFNIIVCDFIMRKFLDTVQSIHGYSFVIRVHTDRRDSCDTLYILNIYTYLFFTLAEGGGVGVSYPIDRHTTRRTKSTELITPTVFYGVIHTKSSKSIFFRHSSPFCSYIYCKCLPVMCIGTLCVCVSNLSLLLSISFDLFYSFCCL